MSRFFCLCINDFPAWAEAYLTPALRDRPLLIRAGNTIIAASATAREAGVQAGWTLARAHSLLPDAISLPHNVATTSLVMAEVLSTFYGLTPVLEALGPGEFLKPARLLASLHRPTIVQPLLRDWTAYGCALRGGIADDRTTAELAALTAEPGKLRTIEQGHSRSFLRHVELKVLGQVGISFETIERLGWFGWKTVHDLRKLTRRHLTEQFSEGETLFRYAAANDVRSLATYAPPPELCASLQFETPAQEPAEWEPALEHLLGDLLRQLSNRTVRTVTIGIEGLTGWHYARQLLRAPLSSLCSLRTAILKILPLILPVEPPAAITGLQVRLGSLAQPQSIQTALFDETRKLDVEILRSLEARFPQAIKRAVIANPHAYLPEEAFLYEPIQLVRGEAAASPAPPAQSKRQSLLSSPRSSSPQTVIRTSRNAPPAQLVLSG